MMEEVQFILWLQKYTKLTSGGDVAAMISLMYNF